MPSRCLGWEAKGRVVLDYVDKPAFVGHFDADAPAHNPEKPGGRRNVPQRGLKVFDTVSNRGLASYDKAVINYSRIR
jgi:hypothetical protein